MRPDRQPAERHRRPARRVGRPVEAALEGRPGVVRPQRELSGRRRGRARRAADDRRVRRRRVDVAERLLAPHAPGAQRAGVARAQVAHAQGPGPAPALAVEPRQLVVLWPERPGVRSRPLGDVLRGVVVEGRARDVVAAVVWATGMVEQAHGRPVGPDQVDDQVADAGVDDPRRRDRHVEVLDPAALRDEHRRADARSCCCRGSSAAPASSRVGLDRPRPARSGSPAAPSASPRSSSSSGSRPRRRRRWPRWPGPTRERRRVRYDQRAVLWHVGIGRAPLRHRQLPRPREHARDTRGVTDARRCGLLRAAAPARPTRARRRRRRPDDRPVASCRQHRRGLLVGVRDDQREVLVGGRSRCRARRRRRSRCLAPSRPPARSCRAGGRRSRRCCARPATPPVRDQAPAEDVAPVGAPAGRDLEVEVVDERVAEGGGRRRVGPRQRHLDRLAGVLDRERA